MPVPEWRLGVLGILLGKLLARLVDTAGSLWGEAAIICKSHLHETALLLTGWIDEAFL